MLLVQNLLNASTYTRTLNQDRTVHYIALIQAFLKNLYFAKIVTNSAKKIPLLSDQKVKEIRNKKSVTIGR